MFALTADGEWLQRHRHFESSLRLTAPVHDPHPNDRRALLVTGHAFIREVRDVGRHSRQGPFALAQRVMGITWSNRKELVQAIPPAYTQFIGKQVLASI